MNKLLQGIFSIICFCVYVHTRVHTYITDTYAHTKYGIPNICFMHSTNVSTPDRLRLAVNVITIVDYETTHSEKDKLKALGKHMQKYEHTQMLHTFHIHYTEKQKKTERSFRAYIHMYV
jgi:hypothetical protein